MDADTIEKDTENIETIDNEDAQTEVTDKDADTKDVADTIEEDSARDSEELSEIRKAIESLTATVNAMQSVILENGARIIDTDGSDIDGDAPQDGYYNLDALDLNLD